MHPNCADQFRGLLITGGLGRRRDGGGGFAGFDFAGDLGGHDDGGFHARWIGLVFADDVERGAVIDAGATIGSPRVRLTEPAKSRSLTGMRPWS